MAKTLEFTYDEFWDAAKKAGLENGFSAADLALAKKNPTAGMQLLQFKINYGNATTDEQRQAANKGAEGVRMQEGGYYGGVTGDDYYVAPNGLPTPTANDGSATSFAYSDFSKNSPYAATKNTAMQNILNVQPYQSQYANDIAAQKNAILNQSPYASEYKGRLDSVTGDILNAQPFSYDKETDPLYNAYRKQYLREGQRAMADTLGQAAANTGGIASSYAVGAAQQAGNYYNSQLNDKLVDLYNAAYNRYTFDIQNKYNQLNALQSLDNNAYNRYQNDVQNEYNKLNALATLDNTDYGRYQNDITNLYNTYNAVDNAEKSEYQKWAEDRSRAAALASAEANRAWEREKLQMAQDWNTEQNALDRQADLQTVYANNASKERINTQDNEYARLIAQDKNAASGASTGDAYLDTIRAAYPNGVTSVDEWKELVKAKGSAWLKQNGISLAPSAVNDYDTLVMLFQQKGIDSSSVLDEDEWTRRKNDRNYKKLPAYQFDSYKGYLRALADNADNIANEGKKQSLGIEE